jgi:hypothetical protein
MKSSNIVRIPCQFARSIAFACILAQLAALNTRAASPGGVPTTLSETKTHDEVWVQRGQVMKHIRWTLTPHFSDDSVSLDVKSERVLDRFMGLVGEITFSTAEDALKEVRVTFSDGKVNKSKSGSISTSGEVIGVEAIFHVLPGENNYERRWQLSWSRIPAPVFYTTSGGGSANADDLALHLKTAPAAEKILYFKKHRAALAKTATNQPTANLSFRALDLKLSSDEALQETRTLLDTVKSDPSLKDKESLREQTARLNSALAAVEKSRSEGAQYDKLVESAIDLLPIEQAPALQGPAGVVFRDLLSWTRKMWDSATDALNAIGDGIESGHLDESRISKASETIERLGQEGPWTEKTAIDSFKSSVENVPVLGKLLKALW